MENQTVKRSTRNKFEFTAFVDIFVSYGVVCSNDRISAFLTVVSVNSFYLISQRHICPIDNQYALLGISN